ncbi:hypothetical protein CNR22_16335 [Sphingobacteriaceae bacterium]|nr:hypothetical protein CNR22_16335 [Sphingobacteriaceae bacterium]
MTLSTTLLIFAILLTGLVAGLFYGYDCSVITGLGNLQDKEYLQAFQSINRAILNPYFFTSFMGSLVLLPVASYFSFKNGPGTSFYFLLSATLVYIIGVMGITLLGNVPLNTTLDQFNSVTASENDIKIMREKFESSWNNLHHWRTFSSVLSFLLCIVALLKK